jgi:hypothetical protein
MNLTMKTNRNFEQFIRYKYSDYVARIEKFASSLGAMAFQKGGHLLIKPLISLARLCGIEINKSVVKVIISYLSWCTNFVKKSNLKNLVLYLKVCSVVLQKRIGGEIIQDVGPLGMRIGHSRGIPHVIPVLHRKRIRDGDKAIIQL